jgi:hypothetical protein
MSIAPDWISLGEQLLLRVIKDPQQQSEAMQKLKELDQQGELAFLNATLQVDLAQVEVNKVEASNESFFVSGARPAIIWVGAASLACYYVPFALVSVGVWAWECIQAHAVLPRPELGLGDLLGLLGSILGVSTLRSADKWKGVS